MGDTVAVTAFREFGKNSFRMRLAMTTLALRHHLVLLLVALGAQELAMLGMADTQHLEDIGMAGTAADGRHIGPVGDLQRHVGLVAHPAVLRQAVSVLPLHLALSRKDQTNG